MSMNDTIADFLTRIRNAMRINEESVQTTYTKMNERIAEVLKRSGYIRDYQVAGEGTNKIVSITLKYMDGVSAITGLQRISKGSKRTYVGFRDIPAVRNGLGVAVLSTPQGILTDEEARQKRVGGEIICNVW